MTYNNGLSLSVTCVCEAKFPDWSVVVIAYRILLRPHAYLSPAIPDPRPSLPGEYPRPGMVGENSYAHL
ncbi:hypothetical protein Y032_0062g3352 [Ancylostoma ceylanicum]|uniref:Uncharacterized protein n=1 Tax=Ancylostoma ceylanicum TaxID=53326 RepID=A0A016U3D7_9BILA|nr:hypothetical protein Y032_0062g3352 [Ancylostoma ceylanicum]